MALICFDFDGTLFDSIGLEAVYYVEACKHQGITIFNSINDMKIACRDNYYEYCAAHGVTMESIAKAEAEYQQALDSEEVEKPLFPGVPEMIAALTLHHTVCIASLNQKQFIEARLGENGITGIDTILGWEQTRSKVQAIAMLKEAHPGEEIYFISDSVGDMKESKEFDIKQVIAVTYGWDSREELEATGVELLMDSVAELSAYLQQI